MDQDEIFEERQFPERLLEIPQPPKRLYTRGTFTITGKKVLSVVGSRKHTSYGADACRELVASLKGLPVVIVSGLCYGIDTIAHETALSVGLTTIAIPGSGLSEKVLYPSQNRNLARRIIEAGGALVSEFEPDFRATVWSFPKRNRIVAGIADAVLVIEASQKSGALITSRLATEYNRDVLAVPGPITWPTSIGTNMLLRLGATPITSKDDLREALGFSRLDEQHRIPAEERDDLSAEEKEFLVLLNEPKSRDELLRELGISVSDFNMLLTMLEIKGVIKEELGMIRAI
jgi:DNA processing protein